jgi:hypothetical protein
MFDQLLSWPAIMGALRLGLSIFSRKKPTRRHRRVLRLSHLKLGRFERVRIVMIDDRRL